MSNAVLTVLKQVDELKPDEFKDLLQHLKALHGVSAGTEEVTGKAAEMYRCLSEAVFKARAVRLMPLKVFASQKGWKKFVQAAEDAEAFVGELESDRVKKLALRRYCCNLIVERIIELNLPLNASSLTMGLFNLTAILDRYFPGYLASGMLPVVLRALYAGTKRQFGGK